MLVYIPLYLISFVGTYYAQMFKNKYKESNSKKYFWFFIGLVSLIFICITLVSACRFNIGYDYIFSDNTELNNIRDGVATTIKEPIPLFVAKFVIKFGFSNQMYFVIYSIITNLFFILAIFINKDNNFMPRMFIFMCYALFLSTMNQVRQSPGIALGMFALAILINYYPKWYSIVISLGLAFTSCLFHYAEIINVAIILIYILFRKLDKKISMRTTIIVCLCILAIAPILFFILKYTIQYIPFFKKYAGYFYPDGNTTMLWTELGCFFMYIVAMFTTILFMLKFLDREEYQYKLIFVYLIANWTFTMISILAGNLMLADRARTMIYGVELFIFPFLLNKFEGKTKITYQFGAGLLMIAISLGTAIVGKVYPYRCIFFKDLLIY
ncbi:MAG: EpsG family protein [Candidatus Onthovivens sp.]|nr:EpsG family protein [Candidatus Onthovivens sp.]